MSYSIQDTCTGCTACVKICPVNAIRGERKHVHQINEQICIECGACSRICIYHAVLDADGKEQPSIKRSLWPKPWVDEKRCVSCGMCIQECPTGAMQFAKPAGRQRDAAACLENPKNCIGCSFCHVICPVGAIIMQNPFPVS